MLEVAYRLYINLIVSFKGCHGIPILIDAGEVNGRILRKRVALTSLLAGNHSNDPLSDSSLARLSKAVSLELPKL